MWLSVDWYHISKHVMNVKVWFSATLTICWVEQSKKGTNGWLSNLQCKKNTFRAQHLKLVKTNIWRISTIDSKLLAILVFCNILWFFIHVSFVELTKINNETASKFDRASSSTKESVFHVKSRFPSILSWHPLFAFWKCIVRLYICMAVLFMISAIIRTESINN